MRIFLCFVALISGFVDQCPVCAAASAADAQDQGFSRQQTTAIPTDTGRWSFSLESLYTFDNVPNPWFITFLRYYSKNTRNYNFVTQILSARYRLTPTEGPSFLRGNLELSMGLFGTAIVKGPESYYAGGIVGCRYNFVQPRARLIPYLELRGGMGLCDAQKISHSMQHEVTFTYLIGAGLRYDLNSRYSLTLGVIDQHISNANLAERDYGADSLGVNIGVQMRH